MTEAEKYIQSRLFALADEKYRNFNSKLIPTVDKTTVIGVRTPELRKLSKELFGTAVADEFLCCLPHKYYEENNLHAYIIEQKKDFDEALAFVRVFLPFVDNWATCDTFSPPVFKRNTDRLFPEIKAWLLSEHLYTVRFALGMLMRYYLDEKFQPEYLCLAADIHTDEYYLHMMVAWYFATALAKQYEATVPYIENRLLDRKTHNKAIQKALEIYRISEEHKQYLKKLKF